MQSGVMSCYSRYDTVVEMKWSWSNLQGVSVEFKLYCALYYVMLRYVKLSYVILSCAMLS